MTQPVVDAELFVERLMKLAEEFPGLPIAVIDDQGSLQVGVLNMYDLDNDDWCEKPVSLEEFTSAHDESTT